MSKTHGPKYVWILLAVIAAIVVIFLLWTSARVPGSPSTINQLVENQVQQNTSSADMYAHLTTATFALVSPYNVFSDNRRFVELANSTYNFVYSNASDFSNVENSSFIVIVVNASNTKYAGLALKAVNASLLEYAINNTDGIIINSSNVWASHGQTVFVLAGYKSQNSLSSALLSFFVRQQVYAPKSAALTFVTFNGAAKNWSPNSISANDPVLDAYLGGTYELGLHDTALHYPYSYYDNFAYLLYYAPVLSSYVPGIEGNSSAGLPMDSPVCIPPPPPPDGSSICFGNYVAMPMMQINSQPPQEPQWNFDTGDCNFFGISDCIDAKGYAVSGINPQLPYRSIPSIYYGFTATGSPIPPSMTGTTGPVYKYLPLTWWIYGPGSVGESTGGFQASISDQQEISLLKSAGVEMFSAPTSETPLGTFTTYNATNSSHAYSCSSDLCGMQFNYSIYSLMSVSSSIPSSATIDSPNGYSQEPYSNYTAVLEPVTLTTPKIVRSSARTYYFSYWSVYSELDGNQYYQQFNTSNATFQVIGPTQAEAIYTSASYPGKVTINSEYLTIGDYETCPPPMKCGISSAVSIPNVNISFEKIGGSLIYANTTGANGTATTPTLPVACYKVTAYKRGYDFIISPNPICINGNTGVFAVDTDPFIFNISWPSIYPYGGAPTNSKIPVNLTLFYASGKGVRAGNVAIHTTVESGKISGPAATSNNGTANFMWTTGGSSGLYDINITAYGIFMPTETYSLPVVVYAGNYSSILLNMTLSNSTIHAKPGASFIDNITLSMCQYTFNLKLNTTLSCLPIKPYPANISISYANGAPPGVNVTFIPNPAQPNTGVYTDNTTMHLTFGSGVQSGRFTALITAKIATPNGLYNTTVPLKLDILANSTRSTGNSTGNSTGYGALNVTVFFNNAPVGAAEINSPPDYYGWYTGSNGEYYTGYVIPPNNYELIGTYDNISNVTTAKVYAGKVAYASIYLYSTSSNTTTTTSSTTTTTSQSTTTIYPCGYNFGCVSNQPIASDCPSQCPLKQTPIQGCVVGYRSWECS